jgi:hypothetical protein
MRITATIFKEGSIFGDGRMVDIGALSWADTIPITLQNTEIVIGHAENLRRTDEGDILADMEIDTADDLDLSRMVSLVDHMSAVKAEGEEVLHIFKGELRMLNAPLHPKLL